MMTTWGVGVEVVAVAPATEGGEVEEWVASEMDPPAEERQTSGNRLKVKSCIISIDSVFKLLN